MLNRYHKAVPEIPVSDVRKAAEYYVNVLGFRFDWGSEEVGIAGISHGACRMVLTKEPFRQSCATGGPVMALLNLDSREEVDELFRRWQRAGANIISHPKDRPWGCEFRVADLDDNQLQVSYDFSIAASA